MIKFQSISQVYENEMASTYQCDTNTLNEVVHTNITQER